MFRNVGQYKPGSGETPKRKHTEYCCSCLDEGSPVLGRAIAQEVSVTFVVDQMVLEQVFLQTFRLFPISIIPPMVHTQLQLYSVIGMMW
jgi:hypothetical protein